MSGGVDSSVTAVLLKEQKAEVMGLFMNNWTDDGDCSSVEDFEDVRKVCQRLDIPCYEINFAKEYRERVFLNFIEDYKKGLTPNPDILCNQEIKFKVFLEKSLKLGADYLATGHYCQIEKKGGVCRLKKGKDENKDQTYFLYTLKGELLKKILFPIGHLTKPEVRALAHKYKFVTADKKDSTGICFIGKRNFKQFLSRYITPETGDFKTLSGEVVGKHDGYVFYTLGQRKGLGIGGPGKPWFVVGKDVKNNIVFVERGEHKSLYTKELQGRNLEWVNEEDRPHEFPYRCKAKIRYRNSDQDCHITRISEGRIFVVFDCPQRAVTNGQSIVFYRGDICLGGAVIDECGSCS